MEERPSPTVLLLLATGTTVVFVLYCGINIRNGINAETLSMRQVLLGIAVAITAGSLWMKFFDRTA